MNTIDGQNKHAKLKTSRQVRQHEPGMNTQESGKPLKIENGTLTALVAQLAKEESANDINSPARIDFDRHFRPRFIAFVRELKNGEILEISIDDSFKDFYAQASKFTWPAELDPEMAVFSWLFDSFIKRVSLLSLFGLIEKLKHDPDLGERTRREFYRRFYPEIKELVKKWESLAPRCNMDASIHESVNCFIEDDILKWTASQGLHKVVLNALLDTLIKIAPLGSLLILMKKPGTDIPLAQRAQTEFYRRFIYRIQAQWKQWEYLGSRYDVEFYTGETFKVFFDEILPKFKVPVKPNTVDQKIINILLKTFSNQAKDNWEEHKKSEIEYKAIHRLFGMELENAVSRSHKSKKSQAKQKTKEPSKRDLNMMAAMKRLTEIHKLRFKKNPISEFKDSLTDADRKILLASMGHYNPYTGRCEMPENTQSTLCKNLKISNKSLIERRSRLMAQLIDFTNSIAPTHKLKKEEQDRLAKNALALEEFYKQGRRDEQKTIQVKPHPKAINPEILRKFTTINHW